MLKFAVENNVCWRASNSSFLVDGFVGKGRDGKIELNLKV